MPWYIVTGIAGDPDSEPALLAALPDAYPTEQAARAAGAKLLPGRDDWDAIEAEDRAMAPLLAAGMSAADLPPDVAAQLDEARRRRRP